MQRTLGNQHVQRLIAQQSQRPAAKAKSNPGQDEHDTAVASVVPLTTALDPAAKQAYQDATLRSANVRFRVPDFEQISSAYLDQDHIIPQKVIKKQVLWLLLRMQAENKLKTKDSIKYIIKKIFPKKGGINKTAFEAFIDTSDRSRIYKSASEAATQVKDADRDNLILSIQDSIVLIAKVIKNTTGLVDVFGSQSEAAKGIYSKAQKMLEHIKGNIDDYITTDYNLDAKEVGIGGGTDVQLQKIHLILNVVQREDVNNSLLVLIHEACHLVDESVLDNGGYYGSPGFEARSDKQKVANAAHYEELPRRELGISRYLKVGFSQHEQNTDDETERKQTDETPPNDKNQKQVRDEVSEYLRKAWSTAANVYMFMRDFRRIHETHGPIGFNTQEKLALEISKMMFLSIHHQKTLLEKACVTMIDVASAESIAHIIFVIKNNLSSVLSGKNRREFLKKALKISPVLFGNKKDNLKLLDWLYVNYDKIPKITYETTFSDESSTF